MLFVNIVAVAVVVVVVFVKKKMYLFVTASDFLLFSTILLFPKFCSFPVVMFVLVTRHDMTRHDAT